MPLRWGNMDWRTYELCYPWATVEEIDAMLGPVFGCATQFAGGRPGRITTTPSECEECWSPNVQSYWVNYNYRCCPECWNVIKRQLWGFLEAKITGRAANRVWGFLIEPAQY